jgi:hypothetical protein
MKSLCIGKGCWAAYHKDNGLQIRPEDEVVGGGLPRRNIPLYCRYQHHD